MNQAPQTSRNTIRRNGNSYIIKSSTDKNILKQEDDNNDVYKMIDDLYSETTQSATCANVKANFYNVTYIFLYIFIIIGGFVIAVLQFVGGSTESCTCTLGLNNTCISSNNNNNSNNILNMNGYQIVSVILGFSIGCIKTFLTAVALEKYSYILKESSVKLNSIARDINVLKTQDLGNVDLFKRIDQIHAEIDNVDVYMFSRGAVTNNTKNNTDTENANKANGPVINDNSPNDTAINM